MDSSIPTPIPLRRRSSPVPLARHHGGSEAVATDLCPQALIVDDCRFIAERVARALEARGYVCTVAQDGYEGLELLRGRRFDLFVLDIDMPMINGFALLRHLRADAVHTNAPVLMLSVDPSGADYECATSLGASAFMTKPLQLRPLYATIDSITG